MVYTRRGTSSTEPRRPRKIVDSDYSEDSDECKVVEPSKAEGKKRIKSRAKATAKQGGKSVRPQEAVPLQSIPPSEPLVVQPLRQVPVGETLESPVSSDHPVNLSMALGLPMCRPESEEDMDVGGDYSGQEDQPTPLQTDVADKPAEEVSVSETAKDVGSPEKSDNEQHAADGVLPQDSPVMEERVVDYDFTTPDVPIRKKFKKSGLKDVGSTSKKRKTLNEVIEKIKRKKARRAEKRPMKEVAEPCDEPAESSSDDIAETPAPSSSKSKVLQPNDPRTRIGKRRVPSNVPMVDPQGTVFYVEDGAARWNFIARRRCAPEKILSEDVKKNKEMMKVITACGMPSCLTAAPWYDHLVRGFLANIPGDIADPSSPSHHKVTFRDYTFDFSPEVINAYLEREDEGEIGDDLDLDIVASILTGGALDSWPSGRTPFRASSLVLPFSVLHKIAIVNWLPTTHTASLTTEMGRLLYMAGSGSKFNVGEYFFRQTVKHAETYAVQLAIAYPRMLCAILLKQNPDLLEEADVPITKIDEIRILDTVMKTRDPAMEAYNVPSGSSQADKDDRIALLKKELKVVEDLIEVNLAKKDLLKSRLARLEDVESEDSE